MTDKFNINNPAFFVSYSTTEGIFKIKGNIFINSINSPLKEHWQSFTYTILRYDKYPSKLYDDDKWSEARIITKSGNLWYVVEGGFDGPIDKPETPIDFKYYKYLPTAVYAVLIGSITAKL